MELINKKIIIDNYEQAKKLFISGLESYQKELYEDAEHFFFLSLKLLPDHLSTLTNLSAVLIKLKKVEKANEIITQGIHLYPTNEVFYLNQGLLFALNQEWQKSLVSFNQAIKIKPDYAEAYYNCGNALQELKRFEEALISYQQAITIKPDYAEAYNNRGITLQELKRFEEALISYQQAITIKPDYAEAYGNSGIVLFKLKCFTEALTFLEKAIIYKPDYIDAYYNHAVCLESLNRFEEAIASYKQAIMIKPDYAVAHWNLSLSQLLLGNFQEGWLEYEWRWTYYEETKQLAGFRIFDQPLWLGEESVKDKTILIYAEQGLGDTIQFCRYIPLVSALGAKIILEVQRPLLNLLRNLEGVTQLIGSGSQLPEFDYRCPLLSLPLAFKTTIDSIPSPIPYIYSSEDNQNKWREYIGDGGFKIAICWQGNTQNKIDVGRSFPVSLFEDISKINGVRLISLQKNEGVEQMKNLPVGMKIETLPEDFDSGDNAFLDSVAVMKCVDLVITSDTALTHLAGSLGVESWLPLRHVPDWRWLLDRKDSPWYPSLKLYRQPVVDDWSSIFNKMETELKIRVPTKLARQQ